MTNDRLTGPLAVLVGLALSGSIAAKPVGITPDLMSVTVMHNGQQVVMDDWELYDQNIRAGCECVINKNSQFATFIPPRP